MIGNENICLCFPLINRQVQNWYHDSWGLTWIGSELPPAFYFSRIKTDRENVVKFVSAAMFTVQEDRGAVGWICSTTNLEILQWRHKSTTADLNNGNSRVCSTLISLFNTHKKECTKATLLALCKGKPPITVWVMRKTIPSYIMAYSCDCIFTITSIIHQGAQLSIKYRHHWSRHRQLPEWLDQYFMLIYTLQYIYFPVYQPG